MGGYIPRMEEMINGYNVLVRKPEGKQPLGRPTCKWKVNIRVILGK
jgi:hypothetical protein